MKVVKKYAKDFFDKYSDEPVILTPYSTRMIALANKYIDLVKEALNGLNIETKIIGSVAYQIPTSDVEISVYVKKEDWKEVLKLLEERFRKPVYSEKEFALFPIKGEEYDFDIHVYTGYEGLVSKKFTEYMLDNPDLIEKYKALKEKYSCSEKQYHLNKNKFIEDVTSRIPS